MSPPPSHVGTLPSASAIAGHICKANDVAAIGIEGCNGFSGDGNLEGDGEGFGVTFWERGGGVREEIWTEEMNSRC